MYSLVNILLWHDFFTLFGKSVNTLSFYYCLRVHFSAKLFRSKANWLSSTGGAPLRQFASPSETFAPPPEIWPENNRKISITKAIYITIDFAFPPKSSWKKAKLMLHERNLSCNLSRNGVARQVAGRLQGVIFPLCN